MRHESNVFTKTVNAVFVNDVTEVVMHGTEHIVVRQARVRVDPHVNLGVALSRRLGNNQPVVLVDVLHKLHRGGVVVLNVSWVVKVDFSNLDLNALLLHPQVLALDVSVKLFVSVKHFLSGL